MDASIFGTVGGQRALAALSSLPQIARELESLTAEVVALRKCFALVGKQYCELNSQLEEFDRRIEKVNSRIEHDMKEESK